MYNYLLSSSTKPSVIYVIVITFKIISSVSNTLSLCTKVMLCSICTESLYMGCAPQATPCGHIFHSNCIMTWFEQDDSEQDNHCPMCRSQCNATALLKIHLSDTSVHLGEEQLQEQIDTLQSKLQRAAEEKKNALSLIKVNFALSIHCVFTMAIISYFPE